MAETEAILRSHLEFLYGSDVESVLDDLLRLMRSFEGRLGAGPRRGLAETDVALITYGDMVTETGRSPLASLGDFIGRYVADVINTVHLLPFYPYSSDDGFSVIDYLEVDPALGDWGDVEAMQGSFQLMFDAVVNHISASSEWFSRFCSGDEQYRDFFIDLDGDADVSEVFRPRELPLLTEVETAMGPRHVWTTFSADQIDLNYRNPEVLLATIEVLLTYVARGASVIRLDAVTFLWKELGTSCIHLPETHRIIKLYRAVLNAVAPAVVLITETNVPHEENVSYFGDGTDEADLVYNFALPPLTLHAFHTGNASVLSWWAARMESPSNSTTFFNFLASHDGIGVGGARGLLTEAQIGTLTDRTEQLGGSVSYRTGPSGSRIPYELNINYLDALGDPGREEPTELVARRFLTSQAVMLSLQGVPAIYFHSLFGSRGWKEGVMETGALRTINRQKLEKGHLEADLTTTGSLRNTVFTGYRQLLLARRSHDAFSPHGAQHLLDLDNRLFAVMRTGDHGAVVCLHNVSRDRVRVDVESQLAADRAIDLVEGERLPTHLELRPYQTVWLAKEST